MRPELVWQVAPPASPGVIEGMMTQLSVPPLLAGILYARGLKDDAAVQLNPPLELSLIPDMDLAAERLEQAMRQKKRIMIHGDYDADGISGTALLTLGLRALGAEVIPFIPNRLTDGYGIHPERVPEHCERADVFITVDCGISNYAEIEALKAGGLEVMVTDHHTPGQVLPDCLVLHPALSPLAQKGLPALTGAGVAYHLLWALHQRLGLEAPSDYADIASIGTIADVAPLMGENRALIQEGLARMQDSRWPGLRATISHSLKGRSPSARDVAFILAPRLNAAGRLGDADKGLELLITGSERKARELAAYLDARNQDRRNIQDEMFEDALKQVDLSTPALVLDSSGWHPGVMGIVASKLVERYFKPVFIIAKGKGSVRSTPGISAVKGLDHAAKHLKRYGGHSQAAGFAIAEGEIEAFKAAIQDYVGSFPAPQPRIHADALISAGEIDTDLYRAVQALEPYGEGHRSPVFALSDTVDMARAVGQKKNHLQLRIAGVKGIAWQQGELEGAFPRSSIIDAAVSLQENEWQGKRSIEFVAESLRPAQALSYALNGELEVVQDFRVRREVPPDLASMFTYNPVGTQDLWRVGDPIPEKLWLNNALPLDDAVLDLTKPLRAIIRARPELYISLDYQALASLEQHISVYPTVSDVRRAFVALKRGQPLVFDTAKAELCKTILEELELVNAQGFVKAGQKRDPYSSETLRKGLLQRYVLQQLSNGYQHLEDQAFAYLLLTLFA